MFNRNHIVTFENNRSIVTPDFLRGRDILILDENSNISDNLLFKINDEIKGSYIFPKVNPSKTIPNTTNITGTTGTSKPSPEPEENPTNNQYHSIAENSQDHNILANYIKYDDVKVIISKGAGKTDAYIEQINEGFKMLISTNRPRRSEFVMALIQYTPSENWTSFRKKAYNLEFDYTLADIRGVQLEIKDGSLNKIIDKRISGEPIGRYILPLSSWPVRSWGDIKEICFTVFLNEVESIAAAVEIRNLRLTSALHDH